MPTKAAKMNTFGTTLFAGAIALISSLASCASDPPPPPATPAPVAAEPAPPPAEAPPAEVAQEPAAPPPECETAEDCGKSKGDAPAGNEWICEANACATRALPEPVKADPPAEVEPAKAKKKVKKSK
jgi:hypothetical protein